MAGNDSTRRRKRPGRWAWGLALLVLVVLAVLALRPAPIEVDVGTATRGPLAVTLDEEGETRVRERYVISAPVAGQVLRIELEPGDPVAAGQTELVQFQPAPPTLLDSRTRAESQARLEAAEAGVGKAEADRQRARAELEHAESELRRISRLAEVGIVSEEALEAARLAADTAREGLSAARFAVATAEHTLAQARATLQPNFRGQDEATQPITIRSPIDGVVLRRLRESAAVVPAGEPLIEVGDPARLEIVADFLSEDAVRIRSGDPAVIERWGGEGVLAGRVRRVEPSGFTKISALGVEEQRVNVIVDFEDPREAWEALGDGFRVEVRVVVWEADDVVQVPTGSLFRHDGTWAVFAVDGGRARLTEIDVGQRNGVSAEVRAGLSDGQRIILHPSDTITDGIAIAER